MTRRRTHVPTPHTGWSPRPAVALGLVILLAFSSLAGIWFTSDRHDEPPVSMMAPDVATPSPDASPGVPMYRANPERTGVMPGPGIDGQPVERWRAEFDGPLTAVPSLVDGVLYLGAGDGGIHAVDAATGETVWTFAGSSPISSTPAIHNGVVVAGSEDGTLYALDAADGGEIWTFPGARDQASVAIVDDIVYTGSGDGFLYALDAATGEEIWSASLDAEASRSPAVSDGVVYQGSGDGVLHTFDAETGEPGWALALDGDGIISTTVIHDGVVYQGTFEGEENYLFALDAATGEELWRLESVPGEGFYNAAADGETVYAATRDGILYALDAATGEVRWQVETGDQFAAGSSPVGDTLYAASTGGVVYALDAATGAERWRFAVEGSATNGLIVSGGVAYVGTGFGYLYAIGGNGEPITAAPAATPTASPVVSSGEPASTPVATGDLATFVWQTPGGDVDFTQPWDLTIAPNGTIWLADGEHHQFQIFTPDGEWVESWGGAGVGSGNGEFNFTRPNSENDASSAVAFAPDGSFYVADMGNQRIQHFGADRQFLHAWGEFGPEDGQFLSPNDIQVDSEGNVIVIDAIRGDIQKFTDDGAFLLAFGDELSTPGTLIYTSYMIFIDADDHLWVPRGPELPLEEWDADGTLIARHDLTGTVAYPVGIAFDGGGRIFVVDALGPHVVIFDSSLAVIGQWGERGDGPGQFQQPQAIAVDGEGNAYVSDYYNGLQKFEVTLPALPVATPVS